MRRALTPLVLSLATLAGAPAAALAAHPRHHRAHRARAAVARLYDYAGDGQSCIAGATGRDLEQPTTSAVVQLIVPPGGQYGGQLKTTFYLRGALPSADYYLGAGDDLDGCGEPAGLLTTDGAGGGTGVIYTPVNPQAGGYFAYVIHPEPFIPPDPGAIMFSPLVRLSVPVARTS